MEPRSDVSSKHLRLHFWMDLVPYIAPYINTQAADLSEASLGLLCGYVRTSQSLTESHSAGMS